MDHPLDDPRRLAALRSTGLLDSEPEAAFDRFTSALSAALGVPVALVSLVDDSRQFFKSQVGLGEPWRSRRGTALTHSFCQHVVATDQPLVVTDARECPLVRDNAAIEDLGVVAYAGVPLHGPSGEPIGSLCAISPEPREWTPEEVGLIRDLAGAASDLITLRSASLRRRAEALDASHRLRSGLTALRLEAQDLEAAGTDDETRTTAARIDEALDVLSRLVGETLDAVGHAPMGHEQQVDLRDVLRQVEARADAAGTRLLVEDGPAVPVTAPVAELGAVLDDLVATLATAGEVAVSLRSDGAGTRLRATGGDLPAELLCEVVGRTDGSAAADGSLAQRAAATLGARLLVVAERPTVLELLLPRR